MPEAAKSNSEQGATLGVTRRQEGDGNDCCNSENHSLTSANPVHTSKPLSGSQKNGDSSFPDSTQEQQAPNEGSTICVIDHGINLGYKPEDRQVASGVMAGDLKPVSPLVQSNTPRSTSNVQLTSKEVRQQSRQLQSQELIRRILQSTSEVQSLVLQPKTVSPKRQINELSGTSDLDTPSPETAQNSTAENAQLCRDSALSQCISEEANASVQGSTAWRTVTVMAEQKVVRPSSPQTAANVKDLPLLTQENVTQINVHEEDSADQTLSLSKMKESEGQRWSSNMHSHITNTGKGDAPCNQQLDSIGSDSLFQSSTLDDGKKDLVNPVDVHQPIDSPALGAKSGTTKCMGQLTDVHELGEKLDKSPTQETLKEILHILKHQSQLPSADDAAQQPIDTEHPHADPPSSHDTQQPSGSQLLPVTAAHLRNNKSLQEKHSRQILDVKSYYESELEKLHIQLDGLRGNLLSLEGVLPIKMMEATNQKLEQRCQLLEEIANELKNKCEKLQMANQDLDVLYCQSQKTNQTLEIRYQFLEQANQVLEEKQLKLQNTIQGLEDRIVEFAETSNAAETRCKQLEEANLNSAARFHQVDDARAKLESRNKKLLDEIQHASDSALELQEVLQVTNKRCQDLEAEISQFQVEKDNCNKSIMSSQQKFEEVRTQSFAKDEVIHKLQEEIKGMASSFNKVIKGKAESEENSKRDKDLLQKLLLEYDALVKEHHQTQMREKTLVDNLQLSEGEVSDLRGTVSKLIHRNSGLEDSLRETLHERSHDNSRSPGSHVFSTAAQRPQDSPARPTNDDSDIPRVSASPALWPGDNHKDRGSSHAASQHGRIADTSLGHHKGDMSIRFNPPRKSTSTPVKPPRRNLDKSYKSPSLNSKVSRSSSNLVVKRADLVTRFDVVFEDVNSGELVSRSHSGHTIRSYDPTETARGVSSRTDSHNATPARLVGGSAEAALNAIRNGKVMSSGEWKTHQDSTVRKGKNKNPKEKSTTMSEISYEEAEHDIRRIVVGLERKFSALMDERKRLESTLSRIPSHRPTKRAKEDKAYLESRLDEVTQSIGSVRMQLRRYHAL